MSLDRLQAALGYFFQSPQRLEEALRHRSCAGADNERLEFLGDAALGFLVSALLFRVLPKAPEGVLTRLRSRLVCRDRLHRLAEELKLSPHIAMGVGERRSGGAFNPSILADTMEAVMGAIYLDGGLEVLSERIAHWFSKDIETVLQEGAPSKDAKTALQEFLQQGGRKPPEYILLEARGEPHLREFHVRCSVEGFEFSPQAWGRTRRAAEQQVAAAFLEYLNGFKALSSKN